MCRAQFRDEHKGLYLLVNLIDWILFGRDGNTASEDTDDRGQEVVSTATETSNPVATETETSRDDTETLSSPGSLGARELRGSWEIPLPPRRDPVSISPRPLTEERMGWVSEAMKVVFNQTVHWKEEGNFSEVRNSPPPLFQTSSNNNEKSF